MLLPILIIIMVLGSIYFGVCTATEAATLGGLGAIFSAGVYRKLNWTLIKETCYRTATLTAMIVWILIGAYCFTAVYTGTGAHELMEHITAVHSRRDARPSSSRCRSFSSSWDVSWTRPGSS